MTDCTDQFGTKQIRHSTLSDVPPFVPASEALNHSEGEIRAECPAFFAFGSVGPLC